jgi:signal transduction histidine kinase
MESRTPEVDPGSERLGGGLGLSIVAAAVSAHGGSVEIDSVEGRGTTVRLVIPASESSAM